MNITAALNIYSSAKEPQKQSKLSDVTHLINVTNNLNKTAGN